MAENEIPEFFFDFDAIKGLSYEDGFKALFFQLQHHYNTYINKKPTFVFGVDPAQPGADRTVITPPADVDIVIEKPAANAVPVTENDQPSRMKPKDFKADTTTVTPKTIGLKDVHFEPSDSGVIMRGIADSGEPVDDILLPGYETPPYGPVVSGRRGRYNLKREVEK